MGSHDMKELNDYLKNLELLKNRQHESAELTKLLEKEIVLCKEKIDFSGLSNMNEQVMGLMSKLVELLNTTSCQVFREPLKIKLTELQERVEQVMKGLLQGKTSCAEATEQLFDCQEMLARIIYDLNDEQEKKCNSLKSKPKSKKKTSSSSWLKLCDSNTEFDAHCSSLPTVAVEDYEWNQSEKFVKIYIDIDGLEETHSKKVSSIFGEHHMSLLASDINGRNYKFILQNLREAIDIKDSKIRLKMERVVVFMKKKNPNIHWTSLTVSEADRRSSGAQRQLSQAHVDFNEFSSLMKLLKEAPSVDMHKDVMDAGCYVGHSSASYTTVLQRVKTKAPRLMMVYLRFPGSADVATCEAALAELVQFDCCFSLHNAQYLHSPDVDEDDRLVKLFKGAPGKLVSFSGSLGADAISALPPAMLELQLSVTRADQLSALCAMPTRAQSLHVRIATSLALADLSPLPAQVPVIPTTLVFHGITDQHVEWLLEAVAILLPSSVLPSNRVSVRPVCRLELIACAASPAAHLHLATALPCDAISMQIQQLGFNPDPELLLAYANRGCILGVLSTVMAA
ncbi:uncharacterized protein LOC108679659 isoform X2 [Hyalella azteca]|uniref:Uncharacterized protein LOC108679659 isoform X2 n=1 Tax=Hyalella azteca TaxID=294128 RepID=A0A8B7PCU8_HYAAZ|nr:uncharacterized protein LOC108679659 isoform X2 [Hyalella azteca]